MTSKFIALFFALSCLACAAPTEKDALQAFTKMLENGTFNTEQLNRYPPGFLHYWVNKVSWGKSYTETYEDEEWTVFVANAVVSVGVDQSHAERYSVKAGVALIQKGDEILMREAFEHEFGAPPPLSAEEVQSSKAQAEKAQKQQEMAAKREAFRKTAMAKVIADFNGTTTPTSVNHEAREFTLSEHLKVAVWLPNQDFQPAIKLYGRASLDFGSPEVGKITDGLKKWRALSAKAKNNKVADVEKDIVTVDTAFGGQEQLRLTFRVDNRGAVSLKIAQAYAGMFTGGGLYGDPKVIILTDAEADALAGAFEKLSADLVASQKACEDEITKQLSEAEKADKKADLFN